jgi:hypothetical protein
VTGFSLNGKDLSLFSKCTKLKELYLGFHLTCDDADLIKHVKAIKNLERLYVYMPFKPDPKHEEWRKQLPGILLRRSD